MHKYHKIEVLFKRDTEGTKRLIEGRFANPTIEFLANNTWQFTEKIDGTNIRVHWDGHKVTFGGRTDNAQIPVRLVDKLNEIFSNNETEELLEQKLGETEVTLYGEGYGAGIQKGGDYRSDVGFILFDVLIADNWQPRESVESIATAFGLEIVPIVLTGTIQDAVDFVKTRPMSTIGTAKMEGVVGRPLVEMRDRCNKRVITKVKVCDFV